MRARAPMDVEVTYDQSDVEELRTEALALLSMGILGLVFGILAEAAMDPQVRRPEMWLVVIPLLGAASSARWQWFGIKPAAVLLIAGLGLAIIAAAEVYPSGQFLYALPLLGIVAAALLGDTLTFAVALPASLVVVALTRAPGIFTSTTAWGTIVLLIWSASALSWLAGRPARSALDWAWRSYLLATARTEELQERQAELGRLAKSLDETCQRLEQMNAELTRARRAADEARHLKAEFAAAISHELRTPLNLVIGFCDTMLSAPHAYDGQSLPRHYRDDLEIIHRNAWHMSHLIDDVLDLSQIEAHRMALARDWASLVRIAEDAIATIGPLYERLGLRLELDAPTELPLAFVDANRIRQSLINLLNNAARFTSRGGVRVRLSVENGNAVIAVSDSGAGIAPEDLPYVFDEFRQVGPPGHRTGGSGLGLAICKQFAELHGGHMTVESTLGQGSTFYLTLPLGNGVVCSPFEREPDPRRAAQRTLAVLDPEGETARVFQRYLDGYRVIAARSPAQIEQIAADQPLCALIIAGTGSTPVCTQLLQASPRLRDLPVFSCSLSTSRVLAQELGVSHYLVKPIRRDQLLAVLRRTSNNVRTVLVVEDDDEMTRLLDKFLRSGSPRRRVVHASNGVDALQRLREVRPDVILLDLLMPGMNGYDLLHEIQTDPSLHGLPVIVVSARGVHEKAMQAGSLTLSRRDGLTVGEVMRCLEGSLNALLDAVPRGSVPAQLLVHPE